MENIWSSSNKLKLSVYIKLFLWGGGVGPCPKNHILTQFTTKLPISPVLLLAVGKYMHVSHTAKEIVFF